VHLGWRELNDVFLLPFEMAVKQARPGSVMAAYHDIDNESCHASRRLLTEVLREEWGFDGLIVADYIASASSTSTTTWLPTARKRRPWPSRRGSTSSCPPTIAPRTSDRPSSAASSRWRRSTPP